MNRTAKSKMQYMLTLIVLSIIGLLAILKLYSLGLIIFIPLIPIVFLIPGRVQGHYYRDMFKARRLLAGKKFNESIEYNNKFISDNILGRKK